MPILGVVSGSGLYDMPGLEIRERHKVDTPYGLPSDEYRIGELDGREIAFLPRHGSGHNIQPHRINYRANVWGFRQLGVEKVLAIGACGGIRQGLGPGDIVVPDQLIDMTGGRAGTFFDGDEVVHIDFTDPFCPSLRESILRASDRIGLNVVSSGTYVCTNGPRLETAAEIRYLAAMGGDVVGMTAMPEAVLAREAGICYAAVMVVTNFAAGISARRLTTSEVVETMERSVKKIQDLLGSFFRHLPGERRCSCSSSLDDARM